MHGEHAPLEPAGSSDRGDLRHGGTAKLAMSPPTTSVHPSTSTNSSSLKGRLISTGGSIIMLIEMSMVLITMSMTRNGR